MVAGGSCLTPARLVGPPRQPARMETFRETGSTEAGIGSVVHLRQALASLAATADTLRLISGLPAVAHPRKVASRKVSEGWRRERDSNPEIRCF